MRTCCLLVLLLCGLMWSKELSPEKLLQQGHQALARGDYERAAAFYEQAELRSTEPAETAFYLAETKYHLAIKRGGVTPELLEAEQLYRCCLDSADPHRPYALLGLGNCLLHKAGSSDEDSLRSAIACYDLCLQSAGSDHALAYAARHNREKARLGLLQVLPPISDSADNKLLGDDFHPPLPRPNNYRSALPLPPGGDDVDGNTNPQSTPGAIAQNQRKNATKNHESPQPGKGNLPPIPDEVNVPPLPPQIASEHLERAAQKVLHEHQIYHRRDRETSAKGVKDW
jgi:tetratricopeptide (TPR) repeat protein